MPNNRIFVFLLFVSSVFSRVLIQDTTEQSDDKILEDDIHKMDFTGHRVLRIDVKNAGERERLLNDLELGWNVDIWGKDSNHVDVQVAPEEMRRFTALLHSRQLKWRMRIDNVQSLIDEESDGTSSKVKRSISCSDSTECPQDDFERTDATQRILKGYPGLTQIEEWMEELQINHPDLVEVTEIGRSFEGRPLLVIKVGSSSSSCSDKKKVWVDAGIHAREWISITTAIYCVNQLVDGFGHDEDATHLLELYDWLFLVVANPDGYQYSRDRNRIWRKNRAVTNQTRHERCLGVDLNRNFPYMWKGHCSRPVLPFCKCAHPCAPTYAGPSAASEPETQAITSFLSNQRKGSVALSLSLHAYSQLWLLPWSYTHETPEDYAELKLIAKKGAKAIYESGEDTRFFVGTPYNLLYKTGGSSMDFAKGEAGIKYSYSLELRDKGRYGYMMPTRFINPIGSETWNGIKAAAFGIAHALNMSRVDEVAI